MLSHFNTRPMQGNGSSHKEVMPDIAHLWCKWHVFKDAELGPIYRKNAAFRDEFHKVITEMLIVNEFNNAWS